MPSREGSDVRVFLGEPLHRETMPRESARRSPLYAAYFDAGGNFHRTSVVKNIRTA